MVAAENTDTTVYAVNINNTVPFMYLLLLLLLEIHLFPTFHPLYLSVY